MVSAPTKCAAWALIESPYKEKKVPDSKDSPKNVYTQIPVNQKAPKYTPLVQLNQTTGSVSGLKVTFIVI